MNDISVIEKKIKEKFPDVIISATVFRDEITIVLVKESVVEVCKFLRDDKILRFDYLADLCGVDKLGLNSTFEVVYHLYSLTRNHRVRLKTVISDVSEPCVESVVSVWPTADWHERETYDMYGIKFNGHPDLRRILTQEGFVGHPLRKDYPVTKRQPENLREIYRRDFD